MRAVVVLLDDRRVDRALAERIIPEDAATVAELDFRGVKLWLGHVAGRSVLIGLGVNRDIGRIEGDVGLARRHRGAVDGDRNATAETVAAIVCHVSLTPNVKG